MATVIDASEFETFMADIVADLEAGDFTDGLDLCRADLAKNFIDIFDAQVSADGQRWPEHAAETIRRYGVHPLLILTSAMYQSVTTDFGAPGSYIVNSGRSMEWGTTIIYAKPQNYGEGRIPSREFMYWTEDAKDACLKTFADYLMGPEGI